MQLMFECQADAQLMVLSVVHKGRPHEGGQSNVLSLSSWLGTRSLVAFDQFFYTKYAECAILFLWVVRKHNSDKVGN